MTDIVERLRYEQTGADFSNRYADLVGESADEIERLRSYLASCVAMIQHAIGTGNDVFIEPDTGRKLSHARAALEGKK